MLITKKNMWYLFFFIIIAFALWLAFSPSSERVQHTSVQQPTEEIKEEHSPFIFNIEHQKSTTHKKEEEDLKLVHTSVTTNVDENDFDDQNYMTHLLELQKQRTKDPRTLLKLKSLPEEDQIQLKEWLKTYKEQGYTNSAETAFDELELQESQSSFINLDDPSVPPGLQETENTAFAKYNYLGAVLDNREMLNTDSLHSTGIKRLYTDNNGNDISLHESPMNNSNSGAFLIDEFVSNKVHDYPVTITKSCTPSARCITKLTLMTTDKKYDISIKGDKDSKFEDYLLEMASSLDLPKLAKQQM